MDLLLTYTLDDPGYGSAEESDRLPEREIPPSRRQLDLPSHSNVDPDPEIARFDLWHVGHLRGADGETHNNHPKGLKFFPPHSNDKPRTSLQIQRQEEYNKPLYQINEDFRRMSFARDSHHIGYVRESVTSSGASHQGIRFSHQGQYHPIGSSGSSDATRFGKSPPGSHDQASSSTAPSLRVMASSVSSSGRSSSLTPVQRRILTVVQIPPVGNSEELMAVGSDEKKKPEVGRGISETGRGAGNENEEEVMDSYDTYRMAGGGRVERKGQRSANDSKDGTGLMALRGLGALRKRKGESKRIRNR